MTAIEIRDLSLSYGLQKVLKKVSFSVNPGEFFMILGPNGAGKSTLLKSLVGIENPQEGMVSVLEKAFKDYSARQLAKIIAMVAQQAPIDFPFSVFETVLMGRTPHLGLLGLEGKHDYELAQQAMEFTDVLPLAKRRLDQLSGGERQRVMIARAICQEPEIILLDEPTTALDPAHQLKIMDLMERFRTEKNTTLIMVSHDLNLAAMYADRLMLLKDGQVVTIGTPQEVFSNDFLQKSYGCDLLIDQNPLGDTPRVTPVPEKYSSRFYRIK